MSEDTLLNIRIRSSVLRLDLAGAADGSGEMTDWIAQAIERALEGDADFESVEAASLGRIVGKQVKLDQDLVTRVDEAAEEAGLERNEWIDLAICAHFAKERPELLA